MGMCTTKPKKKDGEKENEEQESEENDDNHSKDKDKKNKSPIAIPPPPLLTAPLKNVAPPPPEINENELTDPLEKRFRYLCGDKFNEQLRSGSVEFDNALGTIGTYQLAEIEKFTKLIRDKLSALAESTSQLAGQRANACEKLIAHFERKLPPSVITRFQDFNSDKIEIKSPHINLTKKMTKEQVNEVIWEMFSMSVRCLQVALTLRLTQFNSPLQPWWNSIEQKNSENICIGITEAIEYFHIKLTGMEQRQKSIVAANRVLDKPKEDSLIIEKLKEQEMIEQQQIKEVANNYLTGIFSNLGKQAEQELNEAALAAVGATQNMNLKQQEIIEVKKQDELEMEVDPVSFQNIQQPISQPEESHLPALNQQEAEFVDYDEPINEDNDNNHKASACITYNIDPSLKKAITQKY